MIKPFEKILCVLDGPDSAEGLVAKAVALAEDSQAILTLVSVVEAMDSTDSVSMDLQSRLVQQDEAALKSLIRPYHQKLDIDIRVLVGTPFLEIIWEVMRQDIDLVIKVAQSQEWLDRLMGSNDMHLLRKCPCPVWCLKSSEEVHRRVLVAVDLNAANESDEQTRRVMNENLMEVAANVALSEGAALQVVGAWEVPGESALRSGFNDIAADELLVYVDDVKRQIDDRLDQLMDKTSQYVGASLMKDLNPETHLVNGSPKVVIPNLVRELGVDLVVMGTVVRTGIAGFIMGNTAETILNQLDVSVLAIKPPGFVSPVKLIH